MFHEGAEVDLRRRVAVITGAAGGIGLGLARACLGEGMRIVISDVDEKRLKVTADALREAGAEAIDLPCDVGDRASVEDLRAAALSAFGSVDLVCNNAGLGLAKPVLEATDTEWSRLFEVNVGGVINGIRTFLPPLVEQGTGHLNATSSLSGLVGDPDLVVYNGTKFAVAGMMEALALELARDHPGVTASVLCPGPVATDLIATSEERLESEAGDLSVRSGAAAAISEYLAAGLDPDDVGRLALEQMKEGRFWLLTHPRYTFELMEPRIEAMKRGHLHHPDETWFEHR